MARTGATECKWTARGLVAILSSFMLAFSLMPVAAFHAFADEEGGEAEADEQMLDEVEQVAALDSDSANLEDAVEAQGEELSDAVVDDDGVMQEGDQASETENDQSFETDDWQDQGAELELTEEPYRDDQAEDALMLAESEEEGSEEGQDDFAVMEVVFATSGDGTSSDPFVIDTADQLRALSNAVEAGAIPLPDGSVAPDTAGLHFQLGNDIDLGSYSWTGIGADAAHPFMGCFDGAGHVISGMVAGSGMFKGLFGYVAAPATGEAVIIQDLKVQGEAYADNANGAGGLACRCVTGDGLGYVLVRNCIVDVDVWVTNENSASIGCVGGLAGSGDTNLYIQDCLVMGDVQGGVLTGGIVGDWQSAASDVAISNVLYTGQVSTTFGYTKATGDASNTVNVLVGRSPSDFGQGIAVNCYCVAQFDPNVGAYRASQGSSVPCEGIAVAVETVRDASDLAVVLGSQWVVYGGALAPFPFDATAGYGDPDASAGYDDPIQQECTVVFDSAGGQLLGASAVVVAAGQPVAQPEDPVWEGHVFAGWRLGDVAYDFSWAVTGDIVLVATWTDVELPVNPDVDKTALRVALDWSLEYLDIDQSIYGDDLEAGTWFVSSALRISLDTSRADSQVVYDNADATQRQVDVATRTLNLAVGAVDAYKRQAGVNSDGRMDLADAEVLVTPGSAPFTGQGVETRVIVIAGDRVLQQGRDYQVAFEGPVGGVEWPVEAGEYTVVVTAVPNGNYTGVARAAFTVTDAAAKKHRIVKVAGTGGSVILVGSDGQVSGKTADAAAPTMYPGAGSAVYFKTAPDVGFTLKTFNVVYVDPVTGEEVKLTNGKGITRVSGSGKGGTSSVYTFTMPATDVTLGATFDVNKRLIEKNLTGTGKTGSNLMLVGSDGLAAGKTKDAVEPTMKPQVGQKVYFKSVPARGAKLTKFNVTFTLEDGKVVKWTTGNGITRVSPGLYCFTMPNYNVTLNGEFTK